jgi:ATP-dependent RNA helicase HelY
VRTYDRDEAEHLVNSSFAQFQADRDVVRLERTRERLEAYLASYRERMECDRGDFTEYRQLVDKLRAMEQRSGRAGRNRAARIHEALSLLRPGDVVEIPSGRRRGRFVVLELNQRPSDRQPRALVVAESRSMLRLGPSDFIDPPHPIGHIDLPDGFHVRNPKLRTQVARRLANEDMGPARRVARRTDAGLSKEEKALRKQIEDHPAHSCPDRTRHLHYAERAVSVEREIRSIDRRVGRRTSTLARKFERVLEVLIERGYVNEWKLTSRGETLTRIYNESDLLVAEALQRGLFDGLDAAELTSVISTVVFETRGPEGQLPEDFPTTPGDHAFRSLMKLWRDIRKDEDARGLELTREPDAGFVERAHLWASGTPLENVLSEDDAPGDFVRTTKQLVDLLRQLEDIIEDEDLRSVVVKALQGVNRGVVAYSSL